MIRFVLGTTHGPIAIVGICDENLIRMQAGMPLDIDIKRLAPHGMRINRVVVHLGHTYEQVLDDMRIGGMPVTDEMLLTAKNMDKQIAEEKQEKKGKEV